ncbi:MAG: OmpA family protein [Brevundimonas sp.]|uniref:OmpA family protein n=1 Tax=Brevundimonas sp. TaxID=1871086 RepID=UPI0039195117
MRFKVATAALAAMAVSGCGANGLWDRSELIADTAGCAEQRLDIYFNEGQATIAEPARELITMTGERLQGCRVDGVEVIGLASATGDSASNQALSEQRARAVAQALTDAGWPTPQFTLSAAGDTGAVTDSGLAEPLRRRTVIVVHARPQ